MLACTTGLAVIKLRHMQPRVCIDCFGPLWCFRWHLKTDRIQICLFLKVIRCAQLFAWNFVVVHMLWTLCMRFFFSGQSNEREKTTTTHNNVHMLMSLKREHKWHRNISCVEMLTKCILLRLQVIGCLRIMVTKCVSSLFCSPSEKRLNGFSKILNYHPSRQFIICATISDVYWLSCYEIFEP